MLTLYYSPGACSMASHIVLEETGAPYQAHRIATAKGEQRSESYLKINPRGRVPALRIGDDTILTENVAIMVYLAKTFPAVNLLPDDPPAFGRCLSLMSFFASSVHIAFAHINRPERYASDTAVHPAIKQTNRETFRGYLNEIDGLLAGRQWITGNNYTVCDPYALVFYFWATRVDMIGGLKNYSAFKDRMLARLPVKRVIEAEGLALE